MSPLTPLTKQRTVLGVRVGKRQVDWAKVSKVGAVGAGAVSMVAGSLRAWRSGVPPAVQKLPDQVGTQTRKASGQIKKAVGQVATVAGGMAPAGTAERQPSKQRKRTQGKQSSSRQSKGSGTSKQQKQSNSKSRASGQSKGSGTSKQQKQSNSKSGASGSQRARAR